MIRIRGLRKRYDGAASEVLRGIDVDISGGDFVSLVGRSGCGKTTLLNIVGGLDSAWKGEVEVGGRDLGSLGDRELAAFRLRQVGFVFQAYHLLDHLTCAENVALASRFDSDGSPDLRGARQRAAEVLDLVGLGEAIDIRPGRLSGGERQRVAMARALFNRPDLLLLDEPTGNLDLETAGEILALLVSLHADLHMTVVAATHDETIETAGRRLFRMADGRLHEQRDSGT